MKMSIQDMIIAEQTALGRVVVGVVGGQPSTASGSNCRRVIDRFTQQFPALTVDNFLIIPGARRRYRSEGFMNVIVVK